MAQLERPSKWSLADLFPEPPGLALDQALAKLELAVSGLEAMRPALTQDPPLRDFKAALSGLEAIATLTSRIRAYAELSFSADTQSTEALNLRDRVTQVLTDAGNRCIFFDLWFKDLPDATAARLMAQSGDLRYFLETVRRFKPYTLSEAEEKVISSKDADGIDALVNIYAMITDAFTFTLQVDGQTKTLTHDELIGYFQHAAANVRLRAYQELLRVYTQNAMVLAQMYVHRVRDWHTEGMELRGYPSPIAPRNIDNDLPDVVVDTLLEVCRRNAPLFQEFFQFKARALGMEKLRRYDIYAALTPSDKTYDYGVATRMVLDSYGAFSPEVVALVQRVFDEDHIDSEVRPGKRGGAFCYTVIPALTPWVALNYDRHAHDIATLAHELGHAIHNMLASGHSVLTQQSSMPLAETASVFGEMLLTDRLLQQEKDPAVRRELLANALTDAYLTVMRQAYLTVFERDAHAMITEGRTIEELASHYLENLHEQFGEAVEVADEFKWEWVGIPHIYEEPFYTYAYSFGQLLVLALYQQYKQEGPAFVPRYLRILSYGGSEAPLKVLTEAGLDVTSPRFWQGGFDFLANMLAELEQSS